VTIDDRALSALIEESDDLHSDAMQTTHAGLADLVEQGRERASSAIDSDELVEYHNERSRLLTKTLAGMGLVGVGVAHLFASPAFAQSSMDVQAAQTAASLENLAVAVYNQAAGLPFMQSIPDPAGATVVAFVTKTVQQHTDHAKAFNAAATQLGGKAQDKPNQTVLDAVVTPALPTLQTPLDVVKFAATLELVAAETYLAEVGAVSDKNLRSTFASIMGVENQHRAILLAVGALLEAGKPELVMLGPPADQLPAAAGSVGFPDAFLKTDQARPAADGAVK
jgi:hypothetical protein